MIIGGASFFGGRGTVLGVLAGVLIMGLLRNGLNINNVSVFWQQILIGLVIILAVYIDVLAPARGGPQIELKVSRPARLSPAPRERIRVTGDSQSEWEDFR